MAILTAPALLVGCSAEEEEFRSQDEISEEYAESVEDLTLPEGAEFPGIREPEEETVYAEGVGLVDSQWHWLCAWQVEWLEAFAQGDEPRATVALDELGKAPDMEFFSEEYLDDGGRQAFADRYDRAQLGDPSGMQRDVDLNCQPPPN